MKPGILRIHVLGPPADDLAPARWRLCGDELARASSFRNAADASRWVFCRMALRRILGELLSLTPEDVPLVVTDGGKPVLARPFEGVHFNLSHCAELALIAICMDGPVGIDVESSARAGDLAGCEESFCHPDEIAGLPTAAEQRAAGLLDLWTAKEALLKALGAGLLHPPESIRLLADGAGIMVSPDTLPAGLEGHAIRRLGSELPRGFTAAVCHPRVADIFEIIPPLESTNAAGLSRFGAIDTRSDA